jgi:hypothetical protein
MKNFNVLLIILLLTSYISAQELISDPHYQNGFDVLAPTVPSDVEGRVEFDTTKTLIWTCGQCGSKSSFADFYRLIAGEFSKTKNY